MKMNDESIVDMLLDNVAYELWVARAMPPVALDALTFEALPR